MHAQTQTLQHAYLRMTNCEQNTDLHPYQRTLNLILSKNMVFNNKIKQFVFVLRECNFYVYWFDKCTQQSVKVVVYG